MNYRRYFEGIILHCDKCKKKIDFLDLNIEERNEVVDEGSFVCSDCINKEMNENATNKTNI